MPWGRSAMIHALPQADGFGFDVLSNIISNLICLGVPIAVVLTLYSARRRRLRRFFGLTQRSTSPVQVKLSNLYVKPDGTLSPLPNGGGFEGSAILTAEFGVANELVMAIQRAVPFLGRVHSAVEMLGIKMVDPPVSCHVSASLDYVRNRYQGDLSAHRPVDFDADQALVTEITQTLNQHRTFVLVGSPVYNVLTYYVLTHCGNQSRI